MRSSKNRPKGTLETKAVSCTSNTYKDMLINKLLPAIASKWPTKQTLADKPIYIQQDNAGPHSACIKYEVIRAANLDHEMCIDFVNQSANSPDFNALDAGIFNSIQKHVYKSVPSVGATIDDLIATVESCYANLPCDTIDNVFYLCKPL